jgi:mannitol-1-phosphate 5-dehydrogenase
MPLTGTRTYVGFGFGAIQAGLLLYEAFRSPNFRRLVVAEVAPEIVADLRRHQGRYVVNIAHPGRVEPAEVGPLEIEDPAAEADRERLIEAIARAEELGTAVPSVSFYAAPGPGSIHRLLAEGLRRKAARSGPPCVIYAAENHNHAAEILEAHVQAEIPAGERDAVRARTRFLNTVIGKMSGVLSDADEILQLGLAPVTPGARRAFLVEAFNRILITRIRFDVAQPPSAVRAGEGVCATHFRRGIEVFEEKDDLLPFEEAKLYGHNATHALAAYVGAALGVPTIAALRDVPGVLPFLHAAFLQESGGALIRKHSGLDPLFTPQGYAVYADDLLQRMMNPFLRDTVERVGRDPRRKLGWDDRLIGTMRLALSQGIAPRRYAFGAAAALGVLAPTNLALGAPSAAAILQPLWKGAKANAAEREQVLALVEEARERLRAWRAAGCPELEPFCAP